MNSRTTLPHDSYSDFIIAPNRAGDSVVEDPRYVHETVNEWSEDLVVMVTHFTPEGMPTEETDLAKCEQ